MSIITKPETLKDVNDAGISPAPTRDNTPSVERLCEYNLDGQSGCRRTNTILALEADFDTFVDPEMYWGYWDQFCQHEGHSYYSKDWIRDNVQKDQLSISSDTKDSKLIEHKNKAKEVFGDELYNGVTLEFVTDLFKNNPAGFPTLVSETPNFYQCIDLGQDTISIDDLDKTLLEKIKNSFIDNINPLLADLTDKLYLINNKIYCSDCLAFENNPNNKLGVLMIARDATKYKSGNAYFFPFSTLTSKQEDAVRSMALIETELSGEVVIVYL